MTSLSSNQQQEYLMDLIFENDLREMIKIVPSMPTLNFIAESESTPLTLAVGTSEEEIVEYLLLRGADPNFADTQTLPLLVAIERSVEADKYWADNDLEGEQEDPLLLVNLLLQYGADFTKKDPNGISAYEYACNVQHVSQEVFEELAKKS